MRYVLGSRASIGGVLGSGRGGAAAWYLAGGVSAANCIAAYTPKGAASLAASYDNNAAPGNGLADGTYDAAPGVAPTWAAATGWTGNGSSMYLRTGIPITSGMSILVRHVGGTVGMIGTIQTAGARFSMRPDNGSKRGFYNGGSFQPSSISASGVMGMAGQSAYQDGALVGLENSIPGWTATTAETIFLLAESISGLPGGAYFSGSIQALAIYNAVLTAPQVAAISSAMSAL